MSLQLISCLTGLNLTKQVYLVCLDVVHSTSAKQLIPNKEKQQFSCTVILPLTKQMSISASGKVIKFVGLWVIENVCKVNLFISRRIWMGKLSGKPVTPLYLKSSTFYWSHWIRWGLVRKKLFRFGIIFKLNHLKFYLLEKERFR